MSGVDAPSRQVALFLGLFALSVVTDYRGFTKLEPDLAGAAVWLGILAMAAAIPSGGARVPLLAAGAGGLALLSGTPHYSNHEMLYGHVCATILAVYAVRAWVERRLRVELAAFHATLAAVLRLGFLVFYFWVGFHKLNPQFLDPAWSCAVHLLALTEQMLPVLAAPAAFEPLAGPLTVAVELGVLVCLLVPRLRLPGVALAMGFHTLLAAAVPTFQYLVFGYLVLFVPEDALARAASRARAAFRLGKAALLPRSAWSRALLGIALVAGLEGFARWTAVPENTRILGQVTYRVATLLVLVGLLALYAAFVLLRERWAAGEALVLLPRFPRVLLALPLAMFLQGTQPHLGIKSVQSFSMFSNLDTDSGQTNHLLVPAWVQIANHLDDPVFVHPGSDPRVAVFAEQARLDATILRAAELPRLARPFFALQRHVTELARAGETGIRVDYTRGGERRLVENAESDPELAGAGWLVRSYLFTRPIALDRHGACRW